LRNQLYVTLEIKYVGGILMFNILDDTPHVERHMVVGVGLFACMLCDDAACLHVERNS
jgi:hypothetical protein